MSGPRCHHRANALLLFHVGGSLDGEEAAGVQAHVEACPICSREVDYLTHVARGIEEQEISSLSADESPGPGRPPLRFAYGFAAGLATAALIGMAWLYWQRPEEPVHRSTGMLAAATLNLHGGPRRGETATPSLVIVPSVESVAISFLIPVEPGSRFAVELEGPGGVVLDQRNRIEEVDANGGYTLAVDADLLRSPGTYSIVLREESAAEERRNYRYPFRVEARTSAR